MLKEIPLSQISVLDQQRVTIEETSAGTFTEEVFAVQNHELPSKNGMEAVQTPCVTVRIIDIEHKGIVSVEPDYKQSFISTDALGSHHYSKEIRSFPMPLFGLRRALAVRKARKAAVNISTNINSREEHLSSGL